MLLTDHWDIESTDAQDQVRVTLDNLEGKRVSRVLKCGVQQFIEAARLYSTTQTLIQNAFPFLDADDREFLLTGLTPDEWDAMFSGDDVKEDDVNALFNKMFDSNDRNADRIDGYDRDDLGESPDY